MMSTKKRLLKRLRSTDWDFSGEYSASPFSALHWHPSRYASQIPSALIGVLSEPGDLVLDPFVGSGTTCIEAQRLGRASIGIDLNPTACLMTRAKTLRASADEVTSICDSISRDAKLAVKGFAASQCATLPPMVQAEKWYSTDVLDDLIAIWSLVQNYQRDKRTIARCVFSSILLPVCRETRQPGYVCDNTRPLGHPVRNPLRELDKVLALLKAGYRVRDEYLHNLQNATKATVPVCRVVCGDTLDVLAGIPEEMVDLVVTSPPYFGVSDYIKAQRLSVEWFGDRLEPLRRREIGARSKRHRKDAREEYLEEMQTFAAALRPSLKRTGRCVLVVGESASRASVLRKFRQSITRSGFRLDLDLNRRMSSQRRQNPSIEGEHLFVFSAK